MLTSYFITYGVLMDKATAEGSELRLWGGLSDYSHVLFLSCSVDQITDVVLYSLDKYTKTVFIQEFAWAGPGVGVRAKGQDGGKRAKRYSRGLGKEEMGDRNEENQSENWSIERKRLLGVLEGGNMTYHRRTITVLREGRGIRVSYQSYLLFIVRHALLFR
jgi:hypothetical protein